MNTLKDVLIFFSYKNHKTGYYKLLFDPLKEVEGDYDLNLHQGSLKDLYIEIIDNKLVVTESMTGRLLSDFDYVCFELWLKSPQQALAAATYLERQGRPFMGHETLNILCSTKIGELVRLSDSGVPLPRTFMSSTAGILTHFKKDAPFNYPFIAKAADTFGGQMNYLIHSYKELKDALAAHKNQFFVLQEFIPNKFDYRVLVMGGEIKLLMKRSRDAKSDTHLNNTSAGAEGEFVPISDLTDQMQADALKAAALTLRSDFAGVDLIINSETGEHYVLEVNEAPAIQMGANPPVKIAAFMSHLKDMAEKGDRHAN